MALVISLITGTSICVTIKFWDEGTINNSSSFFSLRTLCRALSIVATNSCKNVQRSLYEGFCLSFLTQLDATSHQEVVNLIVR